VDDQFGTHRFEAVVIGEPQRVFYGNRYGLTFPVFVHYNVRLWVPEVGGMIDPESEAHDLVMSVFGGMSKGERTRIKIRVRSAMAAQAQVEGRYLGGRPTYGYRVVDAGPHPNPAKAADGKRLKQLGAALLEWSCGVRDDFVAVAGFVDAVSFLCEVVAPVGVEVAIAAEGSEFEDGFGAGESPAGSGDVHASLTRWRQAPSMTPVAMGQPLCSAVG
jgi:hypothetical protein